MSPTSELACTSKEGSVESAALRFNGCLASAALEITGKAGGIPSSYHADGAHERCKYANEGSLRRMHSRSCGTNRLAPWLVMRPTPMKHTTTIRLLKELLVGRLVKVYHVTRTQSETVLRTLPPTSMYVACGCCPAALAAGRPASTLGGPQEARQWPNSQPDFGRAD
jgi:hypothetical protein